MLKIKLNFSKDTKIKTSSFSAWAYDKNQYWITDIIDGFKGTNYSKSQWVKEQYKNRHHEKDEALKKQIEKETFWQ